MAYVWRSLTPGQRDELMLWRKSQGLPWHRPPHHAGDRTRYHLTAACYEHRPHIGRSVERIQDFCSTLLTVLEDCEVSVHAWCVLPNHYHALIETRTILVVLSGLGRMHGKLSFSWNGEEQQRGRQVWCGVAERSIRNERHFWATLNYVHHNPVRHGYVQKWRDWPFSSAGEYLAHVGQEEAARVWKEYPVLDFGKGWDDPDL
jgi:putative transposase